MSSGDHLLARADSAAILQPHMHHLKAGFEAAWRRWTQWESHFPGPPTDLRPTTQANAIYDLIASEMRQRFASEPKVRVREQRKYLSLHFDGGVCMRFKKFRSRTLKPSGIRTQQAALFHSQQLELADIHETAKPATHVIAGYLLDDLGSKFDRLAITCMLDGEHYWAPLEISTEAVSTSSATPMPGPTTRQEAHQPAARVRSSRPDILESGEGKQS